MRRTLLLAGTACLALAAISLSLVGDGWSQLGYIAGIRLQSNTPGTPDTGHGNITGTMRAGQFKGGTAALSSEQPGAPVVTVTNTAAGIAVHGIASATSGPADAGYFQSASTGGRGLVGWATAATGSTTGVWGQTQSTSGTGVLGFATASSGTTAGGYFQTSSASGRGVVGYATSVSGQAKGVWGESSSFDGIGVYGKATNTGGNNVGVWGETDSPYASGVRGVATATGAGDFPFGVLGFASTATLGYAVFGSGDMGASGTKSFRIDHPFDPENKYLLHYSSESPFPQNFYNGNVTTDGRGYAWVDLPEYFEEINVNFKYQLTVLDGSDDFVLAKVTREVVENRFQIRTSKPNVKVSWMVFADRNDLRIRFKRPTDERPKTGPEKGRYQHPEYYGLPASMGMHYRLEPERATKSARAGGATKR